MTSQDILTNQYDPSKRYQKTGTHIEQSRGIRHVYKAMDTETAVEVAWQEYWGVSTSTMNTAERHIERLKSFNHPHVIKYHEGWIDKKQRKVFFITEAMPTGRGSITNVRRFLSSNVKMRSGVIKNWLMQVLKGLQFLHTCSPPWLHHDLRCENIFIRSNNGLVKIGGLELGPLIHSSHPSEFDGTPGYLPPELASEEFDEKADVYAFGMCALEMFTLKYPYGECSTSYQIFSKQLAHQLPEALSLIEDPLAIDLIRKCIAPKDKRPTTTELFKHPFFEAGPSNGESITSATEGHSATGPEISGTESNNSNISSQASSIDHEEKTNGSQLFNPELLIDPNENSTTTPINTPIRIETTSEPVIQTPRKEENQTKYHGQIVHHQRKPSNLGISHHQRKKSSEISSSSATIKCFAPDKRCIRIYFKDFVTIDQLKEIICSDFDYNINRTVLRYVDHESDRLLITKRTTKNELLEYAKAIYISEIIYK